MTALNCLPVRSSIALKIRKKKIISVFSYKYSNNANNY
jgi:hypothetical protein